jgi:hypothetical protein
MPLLLLGILVGAVLVGLYKVHSPSSRVRLFDGDLHIAIDDGTLRVRKGWVPTRVVATLADILRNAGVSQGYITMSKDQRVAISWHVPPALHQNIRNVLLCGR